MGRVGVGVGSVCMCGLCMCGGGDIGVGGWHLCGVQDLRQTA